MRYGKPSIVEALCEFSFSSEGAWDPTVFGRFHYQIKDEFDVRESGEVIETAVEKTAAGVGQQIRRSPRMRFFNEDRTRLFQIGENLLVVNVLVPYPHWEEFKRLIFKGLVAYRRATDGVRVERTVLRYIDRLEFEPSGFRLGDWFCCDGPYFPRELSDQSESTLYRMRLSRAKHDLFALSLGLESAGGDEKRVVMLDSEFVHQGLDEQREESTLDHMHATVVEAFEKCITERMRQELRPIAEQDTNT